MFRSRRYIPVFVLDVALAGPAAAQQVQGSDPSAPLSPTLKPTTATPPSATSAAHTASEVLAYLAAYDSMGIALAKQGRARCNRPDRQAPAVGCGR